MKIKGKAVENLTWVTVRFFCAYIGYRKLT